MRLEELYHNSINSNVVQNVPPPYQPAGEAAVTKEHGVPKYAVTLSQCFSVMVSCARSGHPVESYFLQSFSLRGLYSYCLHGSAGIHSSL